MSHTYQREVAVFEAALELSPAERRAYLEQACAGDAQLLERVLGLLELHETNRGALGATGSDAPGRGGASFAHSEKSGDLIGPYKLLQQIGQGGCGVVYMAEQEAPIRRRVALKIIKLGMDTRQVIARFEAERQALALMDHPNIAKVFDAGATATGRPYFVMELIRGVKITYYCDEKRLTTRQRLELFIQVCRAVQHAHQKGIIHRDLKPSNILVAMNDGVAVPKLLDFGIAKATSGERLTDKTFFTAFEQFIGTPAYMSPEQAEVTNVDIDTRSDIYSLGVLLYELLTGQTPFDGKELLKAGLDEMRRTLREKEPARPSTRLNTLGADELTTTAQRRGLEGAKLANVLRGDLDWIAMKCLEKDRGRRYETANGLATDIQRHLSNEPVTAFPPGKLYRLQKFVRRNKAAVAAVATIMVFFFIGVLGLTWGLLREREARQAVEALRTSEKARLQKAEILANVYKAKQLYGQSRREEAEKLLNEIPVSALEYDPEHANLRRMLGWWHAMHEEWERSATNFAVLEKLNGLNVNPSDRFNHCVLLVQSGDAAAYEVLRRQTMGEYHANHEYSARNFCKVCLLRPLESAAIKAVDKPYETLERFVDEPSANPNVKGWCYLSLALVDYRRGDFVKAVTNCQACLDAPVHYFAGHLRIPAAQAILAMSYHKLNQQKAALGALAEAREDDLPDLLQVNAEPNTGPFFDALFGHLLLDEAEALVEEHPRPESRYYANGEICLGKYYAQGLNASTPNPTEASKWYRIAAEHGSSLGRGLLARLQATCSDSRLRDGTNALRLAMEGVGATDRKDPGFLEVLAAAYAETGRFDEAVAVQEEALALVTDTDSRASMEAHLDLYKNRKPWRE